MKDRTHLDGDRTQLERSLRIDPDDIDECLVSQPGLFYQVAEEVAYSNSQRDALKLELEETEAELDQQYRSEATRRDEKATDTSIKQRTRISPRIKELQRKLLAAKTKAENRLALKEAYSQRSFMLRELVALQLAHLQNLQVERGATFARHRIGDRNRAAAEQLRRERRGSA